MRSLSLREVKKFGEGLGQKILGHCGRAYTFNNKDDLVFKNLKMLHKQ